MLHGWEPARALGARTGRRQLARVNVPRVPRQLWGLLPPSTSFIPQRLQLTFYFVVRCQQTQKAQGALKTGSFNRLLLLENVAGLGESK